MPSKGTDQAIAQITEPTDTPEEMVAAGNKHIPAIKSSPSLANAPDVATAVAAWDTENTTLDTANKKVLACEAALGTARTDQAAEARRWKGRAQGCIAAINVFADGSKDVVTSFAMGVAERVASPLETVPEELHGVRSAIAGTATARWKTHPGNHGYMVQYATNMNDPATYSVPVHTSAGKLALPGQTPGATIYFRVAACDSRLPGKQTAYTAWVAVVVSA